MAYLVKNLYCIVRCSEERAFPDIPPVGGDGGPVHTVPYDGLAAVVSDSSVREYEATRANLLAHERVQERLLRDFTVLPVRFGTMTSDFVSAVTDLQLLLRKRGQEFAQLLAELGGKVELGLKAFWRNEDTIYQEIVAENPAIRRLRDSLRGQRPEAVRFAGIPLGEMVKEALEQKRQREGAQLLARLRGLAYRVQENAMLSDRLLLNAAFLVERTREAEFDGAVDALAAAWSERVAFRYTGPNPPWNFVNVVVNWDEIRL